jgi:hypothetical protein
MDYGKKQAVLSLLPSPERTKIIQDALNTFSVIESHGVKLSFFGGIRFGRVGQPEPTQDGVLLVASALDLFGTKCAVPTQRVEAEDYMDIAALVRSGIPLADGIGAAAALYDFSFSPAESLRAVTYFKGNDLDSLSAADRETLTAAVRGVRNIHCPPIVAHVLHDPSLCSSDSECSEHAPPVRPEP